MKCNTVLVTLVACGMATFAAFNARAVDYTAEEKANQKLVLDFYAAIDRSEAKGTLKQDFRAIATKYVGPGYIQHSERFAKLGAGREGIIRTFESMPDRPASAKAPSSTRKLLAVMAQGDQVICVTSRDPSGPEEKNPPIYFNMFRVEDGFIAEHWDAVSEIFTLPSPAEVFDRYVAAVHAGDMAAVRALISPQVARSDFAGCRPEMDNVTCLAHYIETTVIKPKARLTVLRQTVQDTVIDAELEVRSSLYQQAGIERIRGRDVIKAQDGLITDFHFIPDFKDEPTAVFFGSLGIGPRAKKTSSPP